MSRDFAAGCSGFVFGDVAAATIIAIIKDIDRWPDKKKLKKALGVYSSLKQSGTSLGRTRQGKEGSRHGRRVLFQVCFGCIRTNVRDNDFKDYYLRQVARDKPRMKALVSTMGKLAEIIYHCLKAGEPYQYQGIYRTNTISTGEKSWAGISFKKQGPLSLSSRRLFLPQRPLLRHL